MADQEAIPGRILVVKLADIGDLLTATPALRALRQSFPQARIDALVTPHSAPILSHSPLVDEVIIFQKHRYDALLSAIRPSSLLEVARLWRELRSRQYDWVIILHHLTTLWGTIKYAGLALSLGAKERIGLDNGRGWFFTRKTKDLGFGGRHEVEYWLEVVGLVGAETEDLALEMTVSEAEEGEARALLHSSGWPEGSPLVVVHPGSGGYSLIRRWPAERFAQVADALIERYRAQIVLIGGAEEADVVQEVVSLMGHQALNLAGKTSLSVLAAILKHSQLFVGNDSGLMHLASAVGIPVVAIFGPSNPQAWRPWGEKQTVVRGDLPCSPCLYRGFKLGKGCQDPKCLHLVTPEMVLEAIEGVWEGDDVS